jgi:ABC-type multidrug transport system fused ATPase/permease subunit
MPKTNVAIVGESGSGKSTFVNLVMRFYDPDHGKVLIDGKDVRDYAVSDLRARMGLVM